MNQLKKKGATPKDVSEIYSIPAGSLANMRCARTGPKYYKVNRRVIYFLEDVEAWIRKHPVLTHDVIE